MKKWLRDNWKSLIIVVIITVVVIPLFINILFKVDFGIELLRAEWDSGDALAFYGVLLAAILAVYGVYLSINYSNKNYRDDLRNQVLPFFAVNNLKTKSKKNWLSPSENKKVTSQDSDIDGYTEYKITDYCFVLNEGKIDVQDGLSDKQKELLDNGGFKWVGNGGVIMCVASDHVCHPMEIENVGNGTALSFRIGLNRKEIPEKERLFAYAIPVKVGEKIMVHIFSEDCGENSKNLGDYILDMHYKDICGNEYCQQHDINIDYSNERNCPVISILFEEKQLLSIRG